MRHTIILIALLCAACSSAFPTFKPYRMDIQQGNIVTSKMLLQLRPGMTQSQVRFIMGTPLIQDSFHKGRWDYFYQYRKDGKIIAQRRVILEFENDSLKRVRGDKIPGGPDPTVPEQQSKVKEPEKGLWDRVKLWGNDKETEQAPAPAQQMDSTTPGSDQMDPALLNAPAPVNTPAGQPAAQQRDEGAEAEAAAMPRKPVAPKPANTEQAVETRPLDSAAAPAAAPASSATAAKPAPAATSSSKPAANTQSQQDAADDLPPEEDPTYFERMLEKIGF